MEDIELKQLAIDISENKVFGTFHMKEREMERDTERDIGAVFMPFLFMSDEQRKEMVDKGVIHLYEYYDKAGPISVNGMPSFFSMWQIVKEDWIKIMKYIREYEARVSSFLDKKEIKKDDGPTFFDGEKK